MQSAALHYTIEVASLHGHLWSVTIDINRPPREGTTLRMPAWAPGSYLIREFGKNVHGFNATGLGGKPLAWEKTDKQTWVVQPQQGPIRVNYRVYAYEFSVRTSHLDGSHGFFTGVNVFMGVVGLMDAPVTLHVIKPKERPDWRVDSPHDADEGEGTYHFRNFEELIDTPVEMGTHQIIEFDGAGTPHRLILYGRNNANAERLRADLALMVQEQVKLWGELPVPRYTFFVHLTDEGFGGLEHMNASVLLAKRDTFSAGEPYRGFLRLAAHEYFHLWNVKRIKPAAFIPYELTSENYTRLLWAFEGITTYYENLLLVRAGLIKQSRYLVQLGEMFTRYYSTPGRKVQTLEESSFEAWIKLYRPDENTPNSVISYYLKGALVALALDFLIRRVTKQERSLDDVMRVLWREYGQTGKGVPERGVEAVAQFVAGADLSEFFHRALRTADEIDFASLLADAGLDLHLRPALADDDRGGTEAPQDVAPRAYMGIRLSETGGMQKVSFVHAGSPADEHGIYAGDILLAINGMRIASRNLSQRLSDFAPGELIRVSLFRRDELMEIPVVLGKQPLDTAYLWRVEKPSAEQRSAYERWLHQPWPEEWRELPKTKVRKGKFVRKAS